VLTLTLVDEHIERTCKVPSKDDVEGQKYMDAQRRLALAVLRFMNDLMEEGDMNEIKVYEFRVTSPERTGSDYRLTLKGKDDAGNMFVAFSNGADVPSCMAGLRAIALARGIYWREDKPWTPPDAGTGAEGRPTGT
jgi:hypothetical protein